MANPSSILQQQKVPTESGRYEFLGSIGLFANGPGRMLHLLFDREEQRWKAFEDWGIPYVKDLDRDGMSEILVQFEGLHLNGPNVNVYSFSEDNGLERASVVTEKEAQGRRLAAQVNREPSVWTIEVGEEHESGFRSREYRYEQKKLRLIR